MKEFQPWDPLWEYVLKEDEDSDIGKRTCFPKIRSQTEREHPKDLVSVSGSSDMRSLLYDSNSSSFKWFHGEEQDENKSERKRFFFKRKQKQQSRNDNPEKETDEKMFGFVPAAFGPHKEGERRECENEKRSKQTKATARGLVRSRSAASTGRDDESVSGLWPFSKDKTVENSKEASEKGEAMLDVVGKVFFNDEPIPQLSSASSKKFHYRWEDY